MYIIFFCNNSGKQCMLRFNSCDSSDLVKIHFGLFCCSYVRNTFFPCSFEIKAFNAIPSSSLVQNDQMLTIS